MNWIRGFIFLLAATGVCASVGFAQDPALVARMTDISERYNECVYFSAIGQIRVLNSDVNLAAEQAFASF